MNCLKCGELVMVESGAYGEYSVLGICTVLQDFDLLEQINLFSPCPDDVAPDDHVIHSDRFYEFLIERKLLQEVPIATLNLGYTDRVSEMSVKH